MSHSPRVVAVLMATTLVLASCSERRVGPKPDNEAQRTRQEIEAIAASESRDKVSRIAGYLSHSNPGAVSAACFQLGELKARQYLPDLIALLKSPDDGVVNMAGAAIREMVTEADHKLLPEVNPILTHRFLLARISAVEILGRIRSTSSTPILLARLTVEDSAVQYYIVDTLGNIRDKAALGSLERLLEGVKKMDHSSPHKGKARGTPPHPQLMEEAIERAIADIKNAT